MGSGRALFGVALENVTRIYLGREAVSEDYENLRTVFETIAMKAAVVLYLDAEREQIESFAKRVDSESGAII